MTQNIGPRLWSLEHLFPLAGHRVFGYRWYGALFPSLSHGPVLWLRHVV